MFPRNCWYVAAISGEVPNRGILGRVVCEIPVAIYRTVNGEPAALLDRCPHRLYPLSKGEVTDKGLQCGYHGLTFAGDGRCVAIPSQPEIPHTACVRSFPVREAHGFIWLWPGEAALAETTPLPSFPTGAGYRQGLDFSCVTDTANWGVAGPERIHIEANYMLVVDNLLDLTHAPFVHKSTFSADSVLASERTITSEGDQVYDFIAMQAPLSPALQNAYQLGVELHDNFLETHWTPPGVMILAHGATLKGGVREDGTCVLGVNIITPETSTTCHYFWVQSVWQNKGRGAVRDTWRELTRLAFAEDEATLRNQQANISRFGVEDLDGSVDLVLKADRAIVMARRLVARKVQAELR